MNSSSATAEIEAIDRPISQKLPRSRKEALGLIPWNIDHCGEEHRFPLDLAAANEELSSFPPRALFLAWFFSGISTENLGNLGP
jgi:hypothetical protein